MTSDLTFRLLNDFQRDFPLVARPFAALRGEAAAALSLRHPKI